MFLKYLFVVFVSAICSAAFASGDEARLETHVEQSETRSAPKAPVTFLLDYKSDVVNGFRGTTDTQPLFLGGLTVGVNLDLDRLVGARGLTATAQAAAVYGRAPIEKVGDYQGTDNISAPHAIKLYQAWLQQNILDDRLSLLAGLHDLGAEFYLTDSSAVLLNNSFGVGPELAHSGRTGPSLWPTTALAARVRVQPTETVQVSAALYDGVPGDPDHPEKTVFVLREDDGVMGVSEAAILPRINGLAGKYAVGAWAYNRKFDDLSEVDENGVPLKKQSMGVYALLDQRLYSVVQGGPVGLSGFLRLGWANAATSAVEYAAQSGLVYTGIIPSREQDQLALAVAVARAGSHYRDAVALKGIDTVRSEATFELTYRAQVMPWLLVQPDLQWVMTPGMNANIADALVGAGRVEVVF